MEKPIRFSDEIRAAVENSGMSRYAICREIELNQGAMSRFMSGQGGISLDTIDRLAELLGLRVAVRRPRKQRGGNDGQHLQAEG